MTSTLDGDRAVGGLREPAGNRGPRRSRSVGRSEKAQPDILGLINTVRQLLDQYGECGKNRSDIYKLDPDHSQISVTCAVNPTDFGGGSAITSNADRPIREDKAVLWQDQLSFQ